MMVCELHEAVRIVARLSDDLAAFYRTDLTEESQHQLFGDA